MTERWRRPPKVLDVEDVGPRAVYLGGKWRRDITWTLDPETTARIRLGYVCLDCLEPHEQAFPERCSLCTFPMRELQMEEFRRRYAGEEKLKGPGISEELARMSEESARGKRERAAGPSQILLPRGVNLDGARSQH